MIFTDKACPGPNGESDKVSSVLGDHKYKNSTIKITRGDYSPLMKRVVRNLELAKVFVNFLWKLCNLTE